VRLRYHLLEKIRVLSEDLLIVAFLTVENIRK
jgi:hypothetical protein